MAARRIYSDPAVGAIVANILQMLNGSPEEAMQKAALAKQTAEVEALQSKNLARNSFANVFANMTGANDIQGNAGTAFAEAIRAGEDPARAAAALLGYAANTGGSNDVISRAYVGAGHAINPNDAFTVDRQDVIRRDNERVKDEETAAQLANAFNINEADNKAANERFYHQPVNVAPGHTVYTFDQYGNRTDYVGSPKAGSVGPGQSLLDVDPGDVEKMGEMLDGLVGKAQMPPELKQKVLTRASELYGQTRNSRLALVKALEEIAQITVQPGWFSNTDVYQERSTGVQPAPAADAAPSAAATPAAEPSPITPEMFAPATGSAEYDPSMALPQGGQPATGDIGPGGQYEGEGAIQKNPKTGAMRIKRNGSWQPYTP